MGSLWSLHSISYDLINQFNKFSLLLDFCILYGVGFFSIKDIVLESCVKDYFKIGLHFCQSVLICMILFIIKLLDLLATNWTFFSNLKNNVFQNFPRLKVLIKFYKPIKCNTGSYKKNVEHALWEKGFHGHW